MGDMGEIFNAMREDSKKRREANRANAPQILTDAGIEYESKNHGAHLIVTGSNCLIDFWPGTGKWISRNGKKARGVRSLIKHIKEGI
ncbi:MAG: hypothetical protein COB09_08310 [Thalassobium sp.]|nr:MAG: hypothetical protein COB09_08310 [Thalassobium sp.]